MVKAAVEIRPDLTADIGPALAWGEVSAEVGSRCRIGKY